MHPLSVAVAIVLTIVLSIFAPLSLASLVGADRTGRW